MIKTYYMLTKPGIIMGNLITTVGGFALASKGHIDPYLLFVTLVGLGCVIASACVCNNYIDRQSDQKMNRTKNRALAKGIVSPKNALLFALVLGFLGTSVLAVYTNALTVATALAGFVFYVGLYSLSKYVSRYATLIGSISGATPPVVGYCAVSGHLDIGAILLFLILVLWQMPHFYSIAVYRFDDYRAASIPVLPIVKGIHATKVHMVAYITAFLGAVLLLTLFGYAGYAYLAVATTLGGAWLLLGFKGFKSTNDKVWARKMFVVSLVTIVAFSVMISWNHF